MNSAVKFAAFTCTAIGALVAASAYAQEVDPKPAGASGLQGGVAQARMQGIPPESPSGANGETPQQGANQIEEIVVTANKRSENLQQVPIAITAVTNARLEAVGITNTADIASVVPGLTIQNHQGGTQAHLRGVGTTTFGAGIENSVATYLDNVYMFSMSGALVQLNNIEQVEVLKGPQGTLFGRNATGGVVNIRTRDPKHERSGQFRLGYASYDTFTVHGYFTAGLTETLAADIAGFVSLQRDGWGKNFFTGNDAGLLDQYAVRSKWLFEPSDRDTFRLIGDYSELKGDQFVVGRIYRGTINNYGPGRTLAGQRPDLARYVASRAVNPLAEVGQPYSFGGGFYDLEAATDMHLASRGGGASLQWDHDFGAVRFTSITAYRKAIQDVAWSGDSVPAFRSHIASHRKEKQVSQELQLGSTAGPAIQWVAGLYFLRTKAGNDPVTVSGSPVFPLENLKIRSEVTGKSGAAFGQATVPLWEGAHLTGGLRYTIEERAISGSNTATFLTVLPPFLASLAGTSSTTLIPELSATWRKLTWRLSFDQQLAPDMLGYASYNRGFKSGNFSATPPGSPPAAPEILDAWEIGLKTELLDRRVRFNIAGFFYKYENIQVNVCNQISCTLQNGAGAEVLGVDMDFTAKIGDHLTLFGGLALLDHKFTSYPGAKFFTPQPASAGGGVVSVLGDAAGNKLPYASDVTFNVGATYTIPIGEGYADLNVNYSYQSRWYSGPDNITSQPGYGLLDATATYRFPGDQVSLGIWARNIANKQYYTFIGIAENPGGRVSGVPGAPQTYGVRVGFKF